MCVSDPSDSIKNILALTQCVGGAILKVLNGKTHKIMVEGWKVWWEGWCDIQSCIFGYSLELWLFSDFSFPVCSDPQLFILKGFVSSHFIQLVFFQSDLYLRPLLGAHCLHLIWYIGHHNFLSLLSIISIEAYESCTCLYMGQDKCVFQWSADYACIFSASFSVSLKKFLNVLNFWYEIVNSIFSCKQSNIFSELHNILCPVILVFVFLMIILLWCHSCLFWRWWNFIEPISFQQQRFWSWTWTR